MSSAVLYGPCNYFVVTASVLHNAFIFMLSRSVAIGDRQQLVEHEVHITPGFISHGYDMSLMTI